MRGRCLCEAEYATLDDQCYAVGFDEPTLEAKRAVGDLLHYIDPKEHGSLLRFVNDSREAPNLQLIYWPPFEPAKGIMPRRAFLVAQHDIPAHVELTFDYGKHYERTWLLEEGAKSSAKAVPVQGTEWPAAVCDQQLTSGEPPNTASSPPVDVVVPPNTASSPPVDVVVAKGDPRGKMVVGATLSTLAASMWSSRQMPSAARPCSAQEPPTVATAPSAASAGSESREAGYPCAHCGRRFFTPQSAGGHARSCTSPHLSHSGKKAAACRPKGQVAESSASAATVPTVLVISHELPRLGDHDDAQFKGADTNLVFTDDLIFTDEDGHRVYRVERLLAARHRGRSREYLVRWHGYTAEHDSWEPASSILDPNLIAALDIQASPRTQQQTAPTRGKRPRSDEGRGPEGGGGGLEATLARTNLAATAPMSPFPSAVAVAAAVAAAATTADADAATPQQPPQQLPQPPPQQPPQQLPQQPQQQPPKQSPQQPPQQPPQRPSLQQQPFTFEQQHPTPQGAQVATPRKAADGCPPCLGRHRPHPCGRVGPPRPPKQPRRDPAAEPVARRNQDDDDDDDDDNDDNDNGRGRVRCLPAEHAPAASAARACAVRLPLLRLLPLRSRRCCTRRCCARC